MGGRGEAVVVHRVRRDEHNIRSNHALASHLHHHPRTWPGRSQQHQRSHAWAGWRADSAASLASSPRALLSAATLQPAPACFPACWAPGKRSWRRAESRRRGGAGAGAGDAGNGSACDGGSGNGADGADGFSSFKCRVATSAFLRKPQEATPSLIGSTSPANCDDAANHAACRRGLRQEGGTSARCRPFAGLLHSCPRHRSPANKGPPAAVLPQTQEVRRARCCPPPAPRPAQLPTGRACHMLPNLPHCSMPDAALRRKTVGLALLWGAIMPRRSPPQPPPLVA